MTFTLNQYTSVTPQHFYYHADGNGNITALINLQQIIVAKYLYDPFGNTLAMAGPLATINSYRFSSKEYHVNSGLAYYLYRFYDPSLQRWPNRDPLSEVGFEAIRRGTSRKRAVVELSEGANLYEFVWNIPLSRIDPNGLEGADGLGGATEVGTIGVHTCEALTKINAIALEKKYCNRYYDCLSDPDTNEDQCAALKAKCDAAKANLNKINNAK